MSTAAVRGVVRHLGLADDSAPSSDAALLTRYARHRDSAAFAELLRRHGPLVLGTCRRILNRREDAEDAFQAVFLVLARKADAVRPAGRVGSWLHGVAVRVASKAKVAAARRWRREMASVMASGRTEANPERKRVGDLERAELRSIIDAELSRMPEKFRSVIVLCDLGGKTRSETARELGCPEGTVAARLHQARKLLCERLTRRGVTLPSAGLGALLGGESVASDLGARTLAAAEAFAAGAATPAIPPTVLTLAEGMIRTMTAGKLKLMLLVLAGMLLAGGGILWAGNDQKDPGANPQQPPPASTAIAAPAPKPSASPWRETKVLDHVGWLAGSVVYSPDGKTLYVGGTEGHVRAYSAGDFKRLWESQVGGRLAALAMARDGDTLAATIKDGVQFLDPATGKLGNNLAEEGSEPLAVDFFPDSAVAPDINARKVIFGNARGYFVKMWLTWPKVSTIKSRTVSTGKEPADSLAVPLAVDPGGKRAVVTGPIEGATGKNVLWAWSAGSGEGNQILEGHKATVTSAAWSKDGKHIVTGDADGVVITWNSATFKERSRLKLGGRVAALAISPDGQHIAAAVIQPSWGDEDNYFEEIVVWETETPPMHPEPISHHKMGGFADAKVVASLAFSPDGKSLASAFCNFTHLSRLGELVGKVRVFALSEEPKKPGANAAPWKERGVVKNIEDVVFSVAFSPDGKRFAAGGSASGVVAEWDLSSLEKTRHFTHDDQFTSPAAVAYSPNEILAITFKDGVYFRNRRGKTWPEEIIQKDTRPLAVAFGPTRQVQGITLHRLAFSNGKTLWAKTWLDGGQPGTATLGLREDAPKIDGTPPAGVAYSPDGEQLVFIPNFKINPNQEPGTRTDPKNRTHWVAQIWGGGSGKPMRILPHGTDMVTAVAWSPDGKYIATGGANGGVLIWDAEKAEVLHRLGTAKNRVYSLAFSPDSKTLAAAGGGGTATGRVTLIDTARGVQVQTLRDFPDFPAVAAAFSPDGKTLIVGTGDPDARNRPLTKEEVKKSAVHIFELSR